MNRIRTACGLVLLAASVTGSGAEAAPRPLCRILVDAPADSERGASLDILSADVGTSSSQITVVVRVAGLARSNPSAPTGQSWYVQWTVPGTELPLFLGARVTPTADVFEYGHREGVSYRPVGDATGVIDVERGEVRVTAPYSVWPTVKFRKGVRLGGIEADTYWFVGADTGFFGGGSHQPGDQTATTASHVVMTPTCVAVGR